MIVVRRYIMIILLTDHFSYVLAFIIIWAVKFNIYQVEMVNEDKVGVSKWK